MRNVPMIDSSGVAALSDFMRRCRARGVVVIVSGIRPQPKEVLARMGFGTGAGGRHDNLRLAADFAAARDLAAALIAARSEEHTSELQSLMRLSYAVFCLKKKNTDHQDQSTNN